MRYFDLNLTAHPLYPSINSTRFKDEDLFRAHFLAHPYLSDARRAVVLKRARAWVLEMRSKPGPGSLLDGFLHEFALTSREGVALMCLAEAALRIPDDATIDRLIRDKLGSADWRSNDPDPDPSANADRQTGLTSRTAKGSGSLFVNASTWALMLTGRFMDWHDDPGADLLGALRKRLQRSGEPVVRRALRHAMKILGEQFVMGRDIDAALARSVKGDEADYRHSFDMLGEAARTTADAARYLSRYQEAIAALGRASNGAGPIDGPGVSIKLSALHPRFEPAQARRLRAELLPRLAELARQAAAADIGFTIDAEDASRLDLQLELFAALCT
ncbi:MAG: proline dehydrogenase family protein, partial [Thiohalocapsa sp.]